MLVLGASFDATRCVARSGAAYGGSRLSPKPFLIDDYEGRQVICRAPTRPQQLASFIALERRKAECVLWVLIRNGQNGGVDRTAMVVASQKAILKVHSLTLSITKPTQRLQKLHTPSKRITERPLGKLKLAGIGPLNRLFIATDMHLENLRPAAPDDNGPKELDGCTKPEKKNSFRSCIASPF